MFDGPWQEYEPLRPHWLGAAIPWLLILAAAALYLDAVVQTVEFFLGGR